MRNKLLIFIALSITFCSSALYSQQGTIKGKVTDSETQTGLSGAEITDASGKVVAVTGTDGSFTGSLPEGKQILYVNLADYDQSSVEAEIRAGETTDAGNIELRASAGSMQDLFTINISEGVEDDGFETQS
ncbi:MAG: carboxypeptidase-like regulatory domain-containing protein, partial [Bacteroidales bacterium]|nr:carboxypeptidase-like regulatory domain-containing protein [Bacteroidales bacterium]